MSQKKKEVRERFRNEVFKRDKYCCVCCGFKSNKEKANEELDSHHITDRTEIINGGYVKENGITLCAECHWKAEQYHSTGTAYPGYSPEALYSKIGSSFEEAWKASEQLLG